MNRLTILILTMLFSLTFSACAQEEAGTEVSDTTGVLTTEDNAGEGEVTTDSGTAVTPAGPVSVNNKICPVSGQEIGSMGEGVTREYNGKIYSFCCAMCLNDFDLDPEKYVGIIEEMMAKEAAQGGGSDEQMTEPTGE